MHLHAPNLEVTNYVYLIKLGSLRLPIGPFACPASAAYDPAKSTRHYAINDPKSINTGRGFASNRDGSCDMKITRIKRPSRRAAMFDTDQWGSYPDPQASPGKAPPPAAWWSPAPAVSGSSGTEGAGP